MNAIEIFCPRALAGQELVLLGDSSLPVAASSGTCSPDGLALRCRGTLPRPTALETRSQTRQDCNRRRPSDMLAAEFLRRGPFNRRISGIV